MNRLVTALVAAAALWIAACSSGGSNVKPPPPAGNFSLASLSGQYAFTTTGEVFSGGLSATPLSRIGTFTADGKGSITGGVEDANTAGSVNNAILVTGGSYTINADGRGTLTLSFQSGNSISFGIVLTSGSSGTSPASDGLMIDETSSSTQSSTGSGNFFLQNSSAFNISNISGPYVFDFPGLDGNQSVPCPCPESFLGEFTASGSGVITTGFFDDNDNGTFSNGSITAGTFSPDPLFNTQAPLSSFGRGIAQIAGQSFVFYIVDSGRIRLLSTTGGMLSGDAVAQQPPPASPASMNGGFVFIVAGASGNGGITRIGRFTVSSGTVSNVLVDTNDAGKFTPTDSGQNASITLDSVNPGRGTVTFKDPNLGLPFTFVFYLSSPTAGVIQDQTQSATKGATDIADGSILAQTGSPFASSNITGTYALNWSGLSVQQGGTFATQDEEDLLAQADITNLSLSGTADVFQFTNGVPRTGFGLGGKITIAGDGTGGGGMRNTMTINLNGASPIDFVVYFASPQLALFANSDNSGTQRIVAGILKAQQ